MGVPNAKVEIIEGIHRYENRTDSSGETQVFRIAKAGKDSFSISVKADYFEPVCSNVDILKPCGHLRSMKAVRCSC